MKILTLKNKYKLVIKTKDGALVISNDDIVYIKADNNYSIFILFDQKKLLITNTLKTVESALQPFNYIRCHKSYLVNIAYIRELCCKDKPILKLRNKHEIPVSREGMKRIKRVFGI